MKRRDLIAAAMLAPPLAATSVLAQVTYPSRPIRIVTPFGTGTGTDTVLRALARTLSEQLSQPVLVENREGASGVIGARHVAGAAPDGYTLLFAVSPPFAVTPLLQKDAGYDVLRDFRPVARVAEVPMVLVASRNAPFSSFAELIAHARAHPGKLDYASAGIGVPSHLFMEQLKQSLRLDITFVPYKSTGQMYTDVISGHVPLSVVALGVARPHLESGSWRALAIGSANRHPLMPAVPTFQEVAPGIELVGSIWYGLLGPHALSLDILARLGSEVERAGRSADFTTVLKAQLASAAVQDARAFAEFLEKDFLGNQRLIQALKLQPN